MMIIWLNKEIKVKNSAGSVYKFRMAEPKLFYFFLLLGDVVAILRFYFEIKLVTMRFVWSFYPAVQYNNPVDSEGYHDHPFQ
jgi:hypothetical protein